jgi:hypothetical protein
MIGSTKLAKKLTKREVFFDIIMWICRRSNILVNGGRNMKPCFPHLGFLPIKFKELLVPI